AMGGPSGINLIVDETERRPIALAHRIELNDLLAGPVVRVENRPVAVAIGVDRCVVRVAVGGRPPVVRSDPVSAGGDVDRRELLNVIRDAANDLPGLHADENSA